MREFAPAHLPIVAMTANVGNEAIDACRVAGFDDYVAKPASIAELRVVGGATALVTFICVLLAERLLL
jgi:CheY-like chemotaxis protein